MFGQQSAEPDCFLTNFFANKLLTARSLVTFVEKQVERLQNAVQSAVQFFSSGNLERDSRIADLLFRASEAFGDGSVRREKSPADFADAETAKGFQRERHLRLR